MLNDFNLPESVLYTLPNYVYWKDNRLVYQGCNFNYAELFGLGGPNEVVGLSDHDFPFNQEQIDQLKAEDLAILKNASSVTNKNVVIQLDNNTSKTFLLSKTPICDNSKKIIGIMGTYTDIMFEASLNKQLSENIINQKDYFESIIAIMPGNVYWLDKNGVLLGGNDNLAKMFKLKSRHDLVGLTYAEMSKLANWNEGQGEAFRKAEIEVMRSQKARLNVEEPPFEVDGVIRHYMSSKVPLYDHNHECTGIVGISFDITDRKRAIEMEKNFEIEKERSHILSILAISIAHELYTPLCAIRVGIEAIVMSLHKLIDFYLNNLSLVEEGNKITLNNLDGLRLLPATLKNSVDSCFLIIDMFLTKMKHAKENDQVSREKFSIGKMVEQALDEYLFSGNQKNLVNVCYDNKFMVVGDFNLGKHVIFNLLKNAIYYIQSARKGKIYISFESEHDYNKLIFKDTGAGIPAEILPKIFDKFSSKRFGGTGLGLAYCKTVMETYFSGKIACSSKEGEYSTFVLYFPTI